MPDIITLAPSEWVRSYADSLFNYAAARVGSRETAKDLMQETLLSAFESRNAFRGESSEKTWLFSILKNKIVDYFRRSANDKSLPVSQLTAYDGDSPYFDERGEWTVSEQPRDWSSALADEFRSKEFKEVLKKCLARLVEQARSVFILKYLEELESDEICKELGISASNYWVIVHRAKLQLRSCLEKNWLEV